MKSNFISIIMTSFTFFIFACSTPPKPKSNSSKSTATKNQIIKTKTKKSALPTLAHQVATNKSKIVDSTKGTSQIAKPFFDAVENVPIASSFFTSDEGLTIRYISPDLGCGETDSRDRETKFFEHLVVMAGCHAPGVNSLDPKIGYFEVYNKKECNVVEKTKVVKLATEEDDDASIKAERTISFQPPFQIISFDFPPLQSISLTDTEQTPEVPSTLTAFALDNFTKFEIGSVIENVKIGMTCGYEFNGTKIRPDGESGFKFPDSRLQIASRDQSMLEKALKVISQGRKVAYAVTKEGSMQSSINDGEVPIQNRHGDVIFFDMNSDRINAMALARYTLPSNHSPIANNFGSIIFINIKGQWKLHTRELIIGSCDPVC